MHLGHLTSTLATDQLWGRRLLTSAQLQGKKLTALKQKK